MKELSLELKYNPDALMAQDAGAQVVERRITWIWALKLPSMENAQKLVEFLKRKDYETKLHDFGDEDRGIAVGWRYSRR